MGGVEYKRHAGSELVHAHRAVEFQYRYSRWRGTDGNSSGILTGNQMSIGDRFRHYAESRMTSSTLNGAAATYSYDGLGNRVTVK